MQKNGRRVPDGATPPATSRLRKGDVSFLWVFFRASALTRHSGWRGLAFVEGFEVAVGDGYPFFEGALGGVALGVGGGAELFGGLQFGEGDYYRGHVDARAVEVVDADSGCVFLDGVELVVEAVESGYAGHAGGAVARVGDGYFGDVVEAGVGDAPDYGSYFAGFHIFGHLCFGLFEQVG